MAHTAKQERKLREIEELAREWGKIVAQEAFPEGVGMDVDLMTMEEYANRAARGVVRGTVETLTQQQVAQLPSEEKCPCCGKARPLERRPRTIQVRGGTAELAEPVGHCSNSTCRRDFFPSASGVEA